MINSKELGVFKVSDSLAKLLSKTHLTENEKKDLKKLNKSKIFHFMK